MRTILISIDELLKHCENSENQDVKAHVTLIRNFLNRKIIKLNDKDISVQDIFSAIPDIVIYEYLEQIAQDLHQEGSL